MKVGGAGAAPVRPPVVEEPSLGPILGPTLTPPWKQPLPVPEARTRLMREGLRLTPDARTEALRQEQRRREAVIQDAYASSERRSTPRTELGAPPPRGTSIEAGVSTEPAGIRVRARAAYGGDPQSWVVEASTSPEESRLQVQFRATFGGAPAAQRREDEPSTAVSARTKEGLAAAAKRLDEAREIYGRALAEARLGLVLTGAHARGEDLTALATELEASEAWRVLVRRGWDEGQTPRAYVARVVGE